MHLMSTQHNFHHFFVYLFTSFYSYFLIFYKISALLYISFSSHLFSFSFVYPNRTSSNIFFIKNFHIIHLTLKLKIFILFLTRFISDIIYFRYFYMNIYYGLLIYDSRAHLIYSFLRVLEILLAFVSPLAKLLFVY